MTVLAARAIRDGLLSDQRQGSGSLDLGGSGSGGQRPTLYPKENNIVLFEDYDFYLFSLKSKFVLFRLFL